MAYASRRSPFTLGRLFVAVLLGLVAGFLWACFEKGRNPLDIARLFRPAEAPAAPAPPPPVRPTATPPAPPPRETSAPKIAEPAPAARGPEPAPAPPPPSLRTYSPAELDSLFSTLEDLMTRGRFFEASEKIKNTSRLMIPPDRASRFAEYETRMRLYNDLVRETSRGVLLEMPRLTRLWIEGGGKLVVKILGEDKTSLYYETLTGIRSKLERTRIATIEQLEPLYAAVEVTLEFKKQCDYRGIIAEGDPGKLLTYRVKPGRTVTGLHFFDLADFCARNGANDKLKGLFDEALQRDPNLLTSVHEAKADRLYQVLLYFIGIKSPADARRTYDLLRERYADTRVFREHVAGDELVLAYVAPAPQSAPATEASRPPPPSTPAPSETARAELSRPTPSDPPPAGTPAPAEPSAPPPSGPTSVRLPDGAPPRAAALVAAGDRYFEEAMRHLRQSDPTVNPDGWAEENRKALELFLKANNEGYYPAQELFSKGAVPQPLLDRVRETTMLSSLCRKRSVSTRH